jgi:ABC-type sugar transport system ATPase subunit
MNLLTLKTHLVAIVTGGVIAATAAWQIQSWRCEARVSKITTVHQTQLTSLNEQLQSMSDEAYQQIQTQQQLQQKQAERIAAIDTKHYQELRHAEKEVDRLRADLAAGKLRLYVDTAPNQSATRGRSVPSGTNTPRLDDGSRRAKLHPEVAQSLINITSDADQCAARLSALQEWVRGLIAP